MDLSDGQVMFNWPGFFLVWSLFMILAKNIDYQFLSPDFAMECRLVGRIYLLLSFSRSSSEFQFSVLQEGEIGGF